MGKKIIFQNWFWTYSGSGGTVPWGLPWLGRALGRCTAWWSCCLSSGMLGEVDGIVARVINVCLCTVYLDSSADGNAWLTLTFISDFVTTSKIFRC